MPYGTSRRAKSPVEDPAGTQRAEISRLKGKEILK